MPFSEELGQCIMALLDHGFLPPLYFTCMAVNGAMVYGCYAVNEETAVEEDEDMHCDILTSYGPDDTFALPINMLFVDQRGTAARVVFGEDGTSDEIQVFPNDGMSSAEDE